MLVLQILVFGFQSPDVIVLFFDIQKPGSPQEQGFKRKRLVRIAQQSAIGQGSCQLIKGFGIEVARPIFANHPVKTFFPIVAGLFPHQADIPAFPLQAFNGKGLQRHAEIGGVDALERIAATGAQVIAREVKIFTVERLGIFQNKGLDFTALLVVYRGVCRPDNGENDVVVGAVGRMPVAVPIAVAAMHLYISCPFHSVNPETGIEKIRSCIAIVFPGVDNFKLFA